ncbi:hypothetical protein HO173_010664 [Letharia columbiana]|uniref:Only prolin and serin are matching in the corresponding protein n=1 Tax=Letharia columbiana TaxID=112416 RepID=A0A8H6L0N5_9LECA|nr:uncharacterized protein HO173_010664 [Letharia columbiana]KAF6231164.1 hypothetical protein HO173_010664 [Letharia columbiana]
MRGRELKPLMLPQLVEARSKEEGNVAMDSSNATGPGSHLSRSSTLSEYPSPTTPTFSLRGHSRLPSSSSSAPSSPNMRESIEAFAPASRPLTDVKEEPQDKDDDYQMVNGIEEHRISEDDAFPNIPEQEWIISRAGGPHFSSAYDFDEDTLDSEFAPNPRAKRRRADSAPLSPIEGLTSRFGSRMPSLSRKWRSRKASPNASVPDRSQEPSLSRANSVRTTRSRAPSLTGSTMDAVETRGIQLPPTPTRSAYDESFEESHPTPIDVEKANAFEEGVVDHEAKPTTPLLPPIMTQIPAHIKDVPYQSPLHSPSVADPEASSVLNSPLPTPRIAGLPSPPLSSRPSISSFHRQRGLGPVSPSSEITPMLIENSNDRWADQLGHANFTIEPVPYRPEPSTLAAHKRLRADWDTARREYLNHLQRTDEHYGATSKIYRLTEDKWAEIDAEWKRNADLCLSHAAETTETTMSLSQSDLVPEPFMTPILKIPSLNGPKSKGKFPTLGEEGIVGPMEQLPSMIQQPQRRKRKLAFFRWVQGVWPAGSAVFGRSVSSSS